MLDPYRFVALRADRSSLDFAPQSIATDTTQPKIAVRNLDFWYGSTHVLKSVSLDIMPKEVTALIGPSGCGKSTFLKCLNRMHEGARDARLIGEVLLDGKNVYTEDIDPPVLRRRFGWVAQKPNPFPWSVHDNIIYGMEIHGIHEAADTTETHRQEEEAVQDCLRRAHLWDELKDRLDMPGTDLSVGQQQRLCIARALSVEPEVLLMDEPCGSLDPGSTERIEALIQDLREHLTVVIITHNMEQAARVSQRVAYFEMGEIVESGATKDVFLDPQSAGCREYLDGVFG